MPLSETRVPKDTLTYVPICAFADNYIWAISDGHSVSIVDPGDADPVLDYLATTNLVLTDILLTHHHADHIGGVERLNAKARRVPNVAIHGVLSDRIPVVTHPVAEGALVEIESLSIRFEVIAVPGHTSDHIAYFQPVRSQGATSEAPHLFCGDTLFATGCGRLFEGTPATMLSSLDKLSALPPETLVHCAHEYTMSNVAFALACEPGNVDLHEWKQRASALRAKGLPSLPTTMSLERRVNPFLRTDVATVRAGLTKAGIAHKEDRLSVFTALRAWKDHFRAPA